MQLFRYAAVNVIGEVAVATARSTPSGPVLVGDVAAWWFSVTGAADAGDDLRLLNSAIDAQIDRFRTEGIIVEDTRGMFRNVLQTLTRGRPYRGPVSHQDVRRLAIDGALRLAGDSG
jgi:hypothetical protein